MQNTLTTVARRPGLSNLATSWVRHLEAVNRAPATIETYLKALTQFDAFLCDRGMPQAPEAISREHIEEYQQELFRRGHKAATVAQRHRSLKQFFKWLIEEGEISSSPMERMGVPLITEQPVPVITDDHVIALLRTCKRKDFEDSRDESIIRLFLDTGARRAEISNLALADVDLDAGIVTVLGKGRRVRHVPFGKKTTLALDRYLRRRAEHRDAELPALWLSVRRGAVSAQGIHLMLKRRCKDAGIPELHFHQFRHTFAHQWKMSGGMDDELMYIAGWRTREMLGRYGASAATERAHQASRRLSLGDRY